MASLCCLKEWYNFKVDSLYPQSNLQQQQQQRHSWCCKYLQLTNRNARRDLIENSALISIKLEEPANINTQTNKHTHTQERIHNAQFNNNINLTPTATPSCRAAGKVSAEADIHIERVGKRERGRWGRGQDRDREGTRDKQTDDNVGKQTPFICMQQPIALSLPPSTLSLRSLYPLFLPSLLQPQLQWLRQTKPAAKDSKYRCCCLVTTNQFKHRQQSERVL